MASCPFCAEPEDAWVLTDDVVAVPHPSSLNSCHLAVAPRRHVAAFYDLDVAEQRRIWEVLHGLRDRIRTSLRVDGFDIGFADAGPDEPDAHAYIHVIPRIPGEEVLLPSGVEWVDLESS